MKCPICNKSLYNDGYGYYKCDPVTGFDYPNHFIHYKTINWNYSKVYLSYNNNLYKVVLSEDQTKFYIQYDGFFFKRVLILNYNLPLSNIINKIKNILLLS